LTIFTEREFLGKAEVRQHRTKDPIVQETVVFMLRVIPLSTFRKRECKLSIFTEGVFTGSAEVLASLD
jgi:hypothetical protein